MFTLFVYYSYQFLRQCCKRNFICRFSINNNTRESANNMFVNGFLASIRIDELHDNRHAGKNTYCAITHICCVCLHPQRLTSFKIILRNVI